MPNEESYLDVSLRKIAKGAGIGFTGAFIGMLFGYLSRIIIARFLGANDYGLISLGFAAMTIAATLSLMGLSEGVVRYVSFYKGKKDKGRIKSTIISSLKISFPLSLFFSLVLFFRADWISVHVFHEPRLALVLMIFAIGVPFWVLRSNFTLATRGFQLLQYQVYVSQVFENIFKLAAIITFLALGFDVLGAAWGWTLAIILTPFLAFYFLEKKVFPVFNTDVKAIPAGRELFLFSWPLILAGIPGLIMGWTDTLMLGYFSSVRDVGIYNAALPTAKLLSIVAGQFGVIFMPVVTELYAMNKQEDLRKTYSVVTKWIFSITLPVFLLMCLYADWIMKIMFGAEYVQGALALSILAFVFFITSCLGLSAGIIKAYGRTKIIMACSFVGAGMNFSLNYLLIPVYGLNGAAVATGLSAALMSVSYLFFVYRIGKMQPFRLSYLKQLASCIIAVLVVYGITKYVIGVAIFNLIVMFFAFMGIYFFLLLLFKSFKEEDLMIMRAIDQRLGIKSDWIRGIIKRFL